ncbi:ABC transporter substrate-binding protein [Embleya scabrispora]|uniref:ABC transporter substrate-binding protein n=1 Tax=Embleya scabrispora TaxID=159449 RepID=UPI0003699DED|nr:extracellular solute-binding protein [Embleya scabrispora]MYS84038.1 extracellular solute-binding protein [Streptomyces sp. SID5474]
MTTLARRSVLAIAAAALVAGPALAGCSTTNTNDGSSDGSGKAGTKTISFLTFETPNLTAAYWDAAIKRVTDRYPDIKVNKLVAPSADGRTNYAKQLRQSGQFPDVMVGVSPAGFAEAGDLYPWSPEELKDFVFPTANPIRGKYYQLPANTQTIPPVYYNKTMFAEAGITTTPTTWDEMLGACARLKTAGHTPFVVGGGKDGFASSMILSGIVSIDVYGRTPDWMTQRRAGKVKFSDPDFTAALAKFADLADKGYIAKSDVSRDYAGTEQAFLDGKGAMYPMGNWFAASADAKHRQDIGVFNLPSPDGRPIVPAYTGGGIVVSSKAANLDAAKRFALAFQLDKTQLDDSVKADGLIPAVKGYTPPADTGPVFNAGYALYQQAVSNSTVVHAFRWETADDGLLPGMTDKVDAAAQDLITGRKSPAQAAKYLDDEWAKAAS